MAKIKKILMPLFIVLGFFITASNIHAATLDPNNYITKVTLTDANGSPISGPVQSGSVIGIDVQWASSDSHPIKAGDTLTIPLTVSNSNIDISTYTKQGNLVTTDGTNIGSYSIQNGKITMNFDNGVSSLMQNSIKGDVKLKAMVTMNSSSGSSDSTNVNVGSQTVTVTAQKPTSSGNGVVITDTSKPQISKSGLKEQSDGTIKWVAQTTVPKDEQEATITDTLGPGQLLDFSSLKINVIGIGEMSAQQFQDQGLGTVTQTDSGFTIKFNMAGVKSFAEKHNVSGIAMQIAYLTRSDFTYDGDFTNTINLTVKDSQNKNESYDSTAQTSNITSSVTVTGIPNTMQFIKRDQVTMAPLSGAQFTIKGTNKG